MVPLARSGCISNEIALLLFTVAMVNLLLVASPTLLGVVLPECVSFGFGENRLTNGVGGIINKLQLLSIF